MWNKVGLDYPLSIGTRRFVPDDRISVRFKPPDKWRLTINNAKLSDSGVYTCTTSEQKSEHGGSPSEEQADLESQEKSSGTMTQSVYRNQARSGTGHKEDSVGVKVGTNTDYYVTVGACALGGCLWI